LRSGYPDPTGASCVKASIKERRRTLGAAREVILRFEDFLYVVDRIGTASLRDLRDRTILLDAYFGPMRMHELQSVRAERMAPSEDDGLDLFLEARKERRVHLQRLPQIRFCPVSATQTYLRVAQITAGPIFVDLRDWPKLPAEPVCHTSIDRMIHARCAAAGLPNASAYTLDSLWKGFFVSGHESGMRISEMLVRSGVTSETARRFKKYARSKRPASGAHLGF